MTNEQYERFLKISVAMSPENLYEDGEITPQEVAVKEKNLLAQWKALEAEVGRSVTETEIWNRQLNEFLTNWRA